MNVSTIEVSHSVAMQKLREYRSLNAKQRTKEDERLQQLYKAVSKGARVINVAEAFRATGLNENGQPKLAIARADWKTVWFHPRRGFEVSKDSYTTYHRDGAGCFVDSRNFPYTSHARTYSLPGHTFIHEKLTRSDLKSSVPHIPPAIRPTIDLKNFHILFEVEKWEQYPVDPFLLRHITGHLFVVIAEWELSALEASLLGAMGGGR